MPENNLVSVITPAWKAAPYVNATIDSVQAQDYREWEMLIVDDCSPDDTAAVVEERARLDSRIRLLRHTRNGGPATARNTAVAAARGRWIAMLDSDDLWLPGKLTRQMAFHRKHDVKLSFTAYRRIDASASTQGHLVRVPRQLSYGQLLGNTAIATSTVLIDRERAGTPTFKKIYYDDFGCWLDLLRDGSKAAGLQEDLMRYRVLGQSVSRNKGRSAREVWKTYRQVEQLSLMRSSYHFLSYARHALAKYANF